MNWGSPSQGERRKHLHPEEREVVPYTAGCMGGGVELLRVGRHWKWNQKMQFQIQVLKK